RLTQLGEQRVCLSRVQPLWPQRHVRIGKSEVMPVVHRPGRPSEPCSIRSEAFDGVRGSGFIPTFRTCRAEARPTVLAAASGKWSPPASSDGVAIAVRRQADVFQQLGGELLGELLGAEA